MIRRLSLVLCTLIACLTLSGDSRAGSEAWSIVKDNIDLGGTSPAAATTPNATVGTPNGASNGQALNRFSNCTFYATLAGATGGTLDVVVQSSVNGGLAGGWYDVIHFPQLAAAAASVAYVISIGRSPVAPSATSPPIVVNKVDLTPALPVNTSIPNGMGNALRVIYVAGVGTSAGAAQAVKAICSS